MPNEDGNLTRDELQRLLNRAVIVAVEDLRADYDGDEYYGPDYAGDPAAWGALMEREGIGVKQLGWREKIRGLYWWGATAWSSDGMMHLTHTVETPGEAVCFAVLFKYGIDPSPYIGE